VIGWKDKDEAGNTIDTIETIDKYIKPVLEKWIGGNIPLNFSKY
jgi:hypothetical protein